MRYLEKRYCFWGPSPRTLQHEIADKATLDRVGRLQWWRSVAQGLNNLCGVEEMPVLQTQISPCQMRSWERRTLCLAKGQPFYSETRALQNAKMKEEREKGWEVRLPSKYYS